MNCASRASQKAKIFQSSRTGLMSTVIKLELVKAAPDAIISGGDPATSALQKATRTIPIVVITEDVRAAGFAASLARPGGNITGISLMSPELDGKRQDILIEAVPSAGRIAVLADSTVATLRHLEALEVSARKQGKELVVARASKSEEVISAVNDATGRGATALNVLASPMLFQNRRVIMEQAAKLRVPAIYQPAMKSTRRSKTARWCARRPCAISRGLRRTRTGTWISGSPVGCAAKRRSARECGRCRIVWPT